MSGFSISGLGSGIDWTAYIASIRSAKEKALSNTLGKQSNKLTQEQTILTTVQGRAQDFKNNIQGFEFSKDFLTKTVSSSDPTVVTGLSTLSASNQSNTIQVQSIATNETWAANFTGVNNSVTSSDGTLTVNVRGKSQVLNVGAGTTLSGLAAQISNAGLGVSATVYDTGDGTATSARIAITDNLTGKANTDPTPGQNFNLSFTSTLTDLNTAAFGATPQTEGLDASIKLNGSAQVIYRQTNTINDVLPGVTINLVSAAPGVSKTLTVNSSTTNASTRINDFITKYNNIVLELQKDLKFDPTLAASGQDQTNPTAGNSALRSALSQLQNAVLGSVTSLLPNRSVRSLSDIGIISQYNAADPTLNGQLKIENQSKLDDALANHFDDTVAFFEGDIVGAVKYDGFSQKVDKTMTSLLDISQGVITSEATRVAKTNLSITDDVQKKLNRIQTEEDALKLKFSALEGQLAKLNSQGSQLTSVFASINGAVASSKK
ncbi:MAG: flagellar cap protein FliD [Bacteriovoracaceae bacterium]|nr:flagellar cap protein FliD [Bacteriovoracaceae bacterium]